MLWVVVAIIAYVALGAAVQIIGSRFGICALGFHTAEQPYLRNEGSHRFWRCSKCAKEFSTFAEH